MIVGLYSFAQSEWISCQTIVRNLHEAYGYALKGVPHTFLNFSRSDSEKKYIALSEEILQLRPTKIIFLDHQPHPSNLLSLLLPRLKENTEIIFHVYGDFLLPYPSHWVKLNPLLKKLKVKLISASPKQMDFMSQFLTKKKANYFCPFPVKSEEFYYSDSQRESARNELRIGNDFCWLYSGRLSLQKNIIPLIHAFAQYKIMNPSNDRLILSGAFDKVGMPYLNIQQADNEYYCQYQLALMSLPKSVQDSILHVGFNQGEALNKIYNMCDAFISLSTFNDEDYGMAVAEAIVTGLPCVLTDWGGYSQFPAYTSDHPMELIKVHFKNGKLNFNQGQIIQKMTSIRNAQMDRSTKAKYVADQLSPAVLAKGLCSIMSEPVEHFAGFNRDMLELSDVWERGKNPFGRTAFNQYYKGLYEAYYR